MGRQCLKWAAGQRQAARWMPAPWVALALEIRKLRVPGGLYVRWGNRGKTA